MAQILVIEDEDVVREFICRCLEREGHQVVCSVDGDQGMAKYMKHGADLIVTDIVMPNKEGFATIIELRRSEYRGPIIAMSGDSVIGSGSDYLRVATRLGANDVLFKPFNRATLIDCVTLLLEYKKKS